MTAINPPNQPYVDLASARPVVAGRGVRGAMIGIGSVFTVLALLAGMFRLLTMVAYDQHLENLTFTAAELESVEVVSIHNTAGEVTVTGTAAPDAQVVIDVGDGLFRARHRQEIDGEILALEASCPLSFATRCRVHHDLQLPGGLGLDVHSRMGSVSVTDVDGDVAIDGGFGQVSVTRIRGTLAIDHHFGGIEASGLNSPSVDIHSRFGLATLAFDEAPHDVRVTSRFGSVVIEVPDDGSTYRLTGSTDFGDRRVDVRIDPNSDRTIHVDSTFGEVTIRYTR